MLQPANVVSKNFIKLPTVAGWNKGTYISKEALSIEPTQPLIFRKENVLVQF